MKGSVSTAGQQHLDTQERKTHHLHYTKNEYLIYALLALDGGTVIF